MVWEINTRSTKYDEVISARKIKSMKKSTQEKHSVSLKYSTKVIKTNSG
jgi:hypothetical protein